MLISHLLTACAITAISWITPSGARSVQSIRRPGLECSTNAECLRKGLPPLPPQRRRPLQRRAVIATNPTCGVENALTLPAGSYRVTLAGAMGGLGGTDNGFNLAGGPGAVLNVTMEVTSSSFALTYYIGCEGRRTIGRGSGGGGGSFMYIKGASEYRSSLSSRCKADILGEPAILVAGGGGGTAWYGSSGPPEGQGGSGGTSTTDATLGLGGQASSYAYGGGAGAGFSQA